MSRTAAAGRQPIARARSPQSGFTLIELMVTLAVVGILAVVAVPAMTSLINGNRIAGATGELTSAMQLARAEAIRRSARVTVCRSTNGETCSNGTAWDQWIVIGRDNAASEEAGSEVIDVIRNEVMAGSLEVTGPSGGIVFRPSGMINSQQTLTVCVPGQRQRIITVMISGSVVTERNTADGGECS